MDRSLDKQQQEDTVAARSDSSEGHKRKLSVTKDSRLDSDSIASNTRPINMSSLKRFKFPGMTSTKPSDNTSKTPLIVRFYDADIQAKDAHGRTQEDILAWSDDKLESCHNYIQMLFPVPEGSAFNWEAPIIDREVMDTFRARSDLRDRMRQSFERMLNFYGFEEVQRTGEASEEAQATRIDETSDGTSLSNTKGITEIETMSSTGEPKDIAKDENIKGDTTKDETSEVQDATTNKVEEDASASTSTSVASSYTIVRGPHWRKSFRNWAVRFDHNHLRITRILRCLRVLGLQSECDAFFEALKLVYNDPSIKISERTLSYWTRAVTRPLYIAPDDEQIQWLKEWEDEQ
jgi:hypothetical protein